MLVSVRTELTYLGRDREALGTGRSQKSSGIFSLSGEQGVWGYEAYVCL